MNRNQRAKEIRDEIRSILLKDWDPIDVGEIPEAADEYDSFVPSRAYLRALFYVISEQPAQGSLSVPFRSTAKSPADRKRGHAAGRDLFPECNQCGSVQRNRAVGSVPKDCRLS